MAFLFRVPLRITDGDRLPAVPNARTDFDDGRVGYGLMRHIVRPGRPPAVLITNGVVTEHPVPTTAQTAVAQSVFLGGHENVVSDAEAVLLVAAGYMMESVDSGYGGGGYGEGLYGL